MTFEKAILTIKSYGCREDVTLRRKTFFPETTDGVKETVSEADVRIRAWAKKWCTNFGVTEYAPKMVTVDIEYKQQEG